MTFTVVMLSFESVVEAEGIVRQLLDLRLIAGANIIPGVSTIYREGNDVVDSSEALVFARTCTSRLSQIRGTDGLVDTEISVLTAHQAGDSYLSWVLASITPEP